MRASRYLKVGIDHGTTNSAIAQMSSTGPQIIPHGTSDIMPSVVYYAKNGKRFIGTQARQAMMTSPLEAGEGHGGYKVRIGQDDRFAFKAVGKVFGPTDLGGMVIGELVNTYSLLTGDPLYGAVITVPAKFDSAAIEGTRKAAEKAGLMYYPLISEPVAAAMAYGFNAERKDEIWMVFDMGGGTLDVTLVMVKDNQIVIPEEGNHGNNNLGGRYLDRHLLDYVLEVLKEKYDLSNLTYDSNRVAWNKLLLAVEDAKIALSFHENAVVMYPGVLCKDAKGKEIEVEVPVSRFEFERRIGPVVEKAINCCTELLKKNRLNPGQIQKIILVGGPTNTPYIQSLLRKRFNIELENSIDPMTAVGLGAAMFAVTKEFPDDIWDKIKEESRSVDSPYEIQIEAESNSNNIQAPIFGRVITDACDPASLSIEVSRLDGGWSSGRLALDEDGIFQLDVMLLETSSSRQSSFRTTVYDQKNRAVLTVEEPNIWFRFPGAVDSLPSGLIVELAGNEIDVLVKRGTSLPCREVGYYRTLKTLRKGSAENVLEINLRESTTSVFGTRPMFADCHVKVGTLLIKGDDEKVSRDIPQGSEVELGIEVDESRVIKLRAYIPFIEDEFEAVFQKSSYGITLEDSTKRFEEIKVQLEEIRSLHHRRPIEEVGEKLALLEEDNIIDLITDDIDRARKGEREAEDRVLKQTLALAGGIAELMHLQWPLRIREKLDGFKKMIQGDPKRQNDLDELERQFDELNKSGNGDFKSLQEGVGKMDLDIRLIPVESLNFSILAIAKAANDKIYWEEPINPNVAVESFKSAGKLYEKLKDKEKQNRLTADDLTKAREKNNELHQYFIKLPLYLQKLFEDNFDPQANTDNGGIVK